MLRGLLLGCQQCGNQCRCRPVPFGGMREAFRVTDIWRFNGKFRLLVHEPLVDFQQAADDCMDPNGNSMRNLYSWLRTSLHP